MYQLSGYLLNLCKIYGKIPLGYNRREKGVLELKWNQSRQFKIICIARDQLEELRGQLEEIYKSQELNSTIKKFRGLNCDLLKLALEQILMILIYGVNIC